MMRSIVLSVALGVTAVAFASRHDGVVSGRGDSVPAGYVPVLVANGELAMTVDRTFGVRAKDIPQYSQGVFLAGRRVSHPKRELLPQGRWTKRLLVGGRDAGVPETWEQRLDTQTGIVTCRMRYPGGLNFEGETFIPRCENTIAIRMTVRNAGAADLPVTLGVAYDAPQHPRICGEWKRDGDRRIWKYRSYGHNVLDGETTVTGDDVTLTLAPGQEETRTFFIACSDTMRRHPGLAADYAALRARTVEDWARFYGESEVKLPDADLQRMWEMANYHLYANATRWSFPIGILDSHWQGLYFGFDEMYMFQGLASSGHLDVSRHVPDYRFATIKPALSRNRYGHHKRFSKYGARWFWESLEDGQSEGTVAGEWMEHIFHMATIAKSAWLQGRYGRDRAWFAEKGYPLVYESARYFRHNWVYEDSNGDTYIGKCCDLERLGPARNHPFMTTVGAIYTLRAAADASELLKTNLTDVADFRACADRLEKWLPRKDGRFISDYDGPQESMATLAGFYPFPIFPGDHRMQRDTVVHFINEGRASGNMYPTGKKVCPWYAGTMSAAASWMGDRREAVRWLREAWSAAGCFGEYFEINEPGVAVCHPWFPTAAGNCLYAINQMLLCDHADAIYVGSTVPEDWRDYSFRLPSLRGVTVDCAVRGGKLVRLVLTPREGVTEKAKVVVRAEMLEGQPVPAGFAMENAKDGKLVLHPVPEWSITLQPLVKDDEKPSSPVKLSGARQSMRMENNADGVKRFVCERLTDGEKMWNVRIILEERTVDGGRTYTGRIENRHEGVRVIAFEGPYSDGVRTDPQQSTIYVPDGLGRRFADFPASTAKLPTIARSQKGVFYRTGWHASDDGRAVFTTGDYPGATGLTMPWLALDGDGTGLYAAVQSREVHPFRMVLRYDPKEGRSDIGFEHRLFLESGQDRTLGETVFAPYAGDWHVAAKKYRAWYDTVRSVGSCSPAWTQGISGWLLVIMKQQNEQVFWPYGDIPKLCDVAEANGLDCIGLFGWTKGGHDHLYPDYEADPKMGGVDALKAGIAEARRRGLRVVIYANGQLQHVGATRFWHEHGKDLALTREDGSLVIQNYHKYADIPKYDFALGCLYAQPWHERMFALAQQAEGFGADGILYDQLGIFAPFACWGRGHGHPMPGYSYCAERPGFIRSIADAMQKENPQFAILTEGLHDTILDSIALFHGCETGTYPQVLKEIAARATGGRTGAFPELWRYTFPELVTTTRVPSPLSTRTMVNYTTLFGMRHDIELRYAPDRDWVLDGKVPTKEGYGTVRSLPDVGWMQTNEPKAAAAYLKAANLFQRQYAKYLLTGRFLDEEGFTLKAPAGVLAKRYLARDGLSAVLVWNMTDRSVPVSIGGLGVPSVTSEPGAGTVAADAPLAADTLRLYGYER